MYYNAQALDYLEKAKESLQFIPYKSSTIYVGYKDRHQSYSPLTINGTNGTISQSLVLIEDLPKVIFLDDFDLTAIDKSMLQAFYSRSGKSILNKLKELNVTTYIDNIEDKDNASINTLESKLAKFFINYNHGSIGDCGTLTICIENVPLPVAKLIQADPLYSGQESSTRYINFDTKLDKYPLHKELYNTEVERLKNKFIEEGLSEKSAKLKAFDIARGILPLGTLTQLSWHSSLRTILRKCSAMQTSVFPEAVQVANAILMGLKDRYPILMKDININKDTSSFKALTIRQVIAEMYVTDKSTNHSDFDTVVIPTSNSSFLDLSNSSNTSITQDIYNPSYAKNSKQVKLEYNNLDYGCYRDIQRHRTVDWNIEEYIPESVDNLSHEYMQHYGINTVLKLQNKNRQRRNLILDEIKDLIDCYNDNCTLQEATDGINISDLLENTIIDYIYNKPLATCLMKLTGIVSYKNAEYILRLRSGDTVHPILRKLVQKQCEDIGLERELRDTDYSKRSKQDITLDPGLDL